MTLEPYPTQSWQTCMEAILPSEVLAAAAPFLENMSQETTPLSPHYPIPEAGNRQSSEALNNTDNLCSTADHPNRASLLGQYFCNPQPLSDEWAKARNILVMRLDNIGDVIMTGPALRAIKENLPSSSVR